MDKYIEAALPLAEINRAAMRERAGKAGHPANLHMWWGRSRVASSLAVLAAALLDYSEDTAAADLELIARAASGDAADLVPAPFTVPLPAVLPYGCCASQEGSFTWALDGISSFMPSVTASARFSHDSAACCVKPPARSTAS